METLGMFSLLLLLKRANRAFQEGVRDLSIYEKRVRGPELKN
jgi:hypothetical protein